MKLYDVIHNEADSTRTDSVEVFLLGNQIQKIYSEEIQITCITKWSQLKMLEFGPLWEPFIRISTHQSLDHDTEDTLWEIISWAFSEWNI